MSARLFLPVVSLLLIPVIAHSLRAQGPTGRGFCIADGSAPVVYVASGFDTKLKAGSPYRSRIMGYEFGQYVKGRFGTQDASPFVATCASYPTEAEVERIKQIYEEPVIQSKRKIVSVPWSYQPDPAEVQFSFAAVATDIDRSPEMPRDPTDQGFCVTEQFSAPLYSSAVFPATSQFNLAEWQIAWMKFLGAKYGYKGEVYCSNSWRGPSARMMAARIAGARAASRQVVETGWKYVAIVDPGPKPDPDPEPVRGAAAAVAAAPPPQLRDVAAKDGAAALTTCQSDRMLNGAFDCYSMQRTVYNYRLAHPPTGGEPLATLFADDKFDCTLCFDASKTEVWATNRAQSNGFTFEKAKCVGPKFVALLKAKPYVNRVKELFDSAMKACPK